MKQEVDFKLLKNKSPKKKNSPKKMSPNKENQSQMSKKLSNSSIGKHKNSILSS